MKGGKDEGKRHLDPLFPKLHINDAEKGGPRAPPRNKMALSEQFSVPSPRFAAGSSMSMRMLPPSHGSNSVPSTSANHVGYHKKDMFSPFNNLPGPSHMAERFHPYSSARLNLGTNMTNHKLQPLKLCNYQTITGARQLMTTDEINLFRPHSFTAYQNSSGKLLGHKDDFIVPAFAQSRRTVNYGVIQNKLDNGKLSLPSVNASVKVHAANGKTFNQSANLDLKLRNHCDNQVEEDCKVDQTSQHQRREATLVLAIGEKTVETSASHRRASGKVPEAANKAPASIKLEDNAILVDDLSSSDKPCVDLNLECQILQEDRTNRVGPFQMLERTSRKRSASTMEGPSCSVPQIEDCCSSPEKLESLKRRPNDHDYVSSHEGHVGKNKNISDTSVEESIPGLDISPDDVAGVIGQKQFWRARRTIVHQQRIFALQVFELHRLIEVQRLMAESPEMLFDDNFYMKEPCIELTPAKNLQSGNALESVPSGVKQKVDCQKTNPRWGCAAEMTLGKRTASSEEPGKGHVSQQLAQKTHLVRFPSASPVTDVKLAPLCIHPTPGNQWLIPVKSPSEGLIYKPYAGPCPPTGGIIAPVYGSCGTLGLTVVGGDVFNTPSQQQGFGIYPRPAALGQNCFEPFSIPMIKTPVSSSTIEQMAPLSRARYTARDTRLTSDIDINRSHQRSRNIPRQKSGDFCKFLGSTKVNAVQGSTVSSPPEKVQGDALSLFPTTPTVQEPDQPVQNHSTEQQIQAIKVVPHNPKSASESVARIFQSIQEERRRHD